MSVYHYRAKEGPERIVEGTIEASTKEEALRRVEQRGYFPIKLEESISHQKVSERIFSRRVRPRKITIFTRQLATLLRSGVPILRALEIIISQIEDTSFQMILSKIHTEVKEGQTFSGALSGYPQIFSNFYLSMVRVGEDSGTLDKVLARIAQHREAQQQIRSKIKIALVYPIVMFLVGLGTVVFMLTFVMPRLMKIFTDVESELPLITQILISASQFLKEQWPVLTIIICAGFFIYIRESKRKEFKLASSVAKLRIPFIKNFVLRKELARFSRTLEALIKSGIPVLKALELTIPVLDNEIIKKEFLRSLKEVEDGVSIGVSFRKSRVIPSFVSSLVSVGEESGKLDEALGELAATYEGELEENIKVFTTLLEPLMIVVMGLLVGFVVMAMLLPIFQINIMIS